LLLALALRVHAIERAAAREDDRAAAVVVVGVCDAREEYQQQRGSHCTSFAARSAPLVSDVTKRPLPGTSSSTASPKRGKCTSSERTPPSTVCASFSNCCLVSGLPSTNTSDKNSSGAIHDAPSRWILSRIEPVRLSELRTI